MTTKVYKTHSHSRVQMLADKLRESYTSWRDAMDDPNCVDAAEWVVRSIFQPGLASSVPVPDPDAPGGEIVNVLCNRFGV